MKKVVEIRIISKKRCKVEFTNDDDKDDYIVSIKHLKDGSTITTKARPKANDEA